MTEVVQQHFRREDMSEAYTGGCACDRSSLKLEGEAKHWDIVGDSGNVKTRAFCPTCGSPVYMTFTATPDLVTVHAASLDDPSRCKPQMAPYGVRGHAWDHLDPALPKFDKMPPPQ
jgi:hypothetical protein